MSTPAPYRNNLLLRVFHAIWNRTTLIYRPGAIVHSVTHHQPIYFLQSYMLPAQDKLIILRPTESTGEHGTHFTFTKLLWRRRVWNGVNIAEWLLKARPGPSVVGIRHTITVLSMLQDASIESSGDLPWRIHVVNGVPGEEAGYEGGEEGVCVELQLLRRRKFSSDDGSIP